MLHVECMTMQRDPIYHSIVTSKPPQEDHGLGKATERIFLPLLKLLIPDIVDYDLPDAGVFHNCVIVSIHKRYPKHAQKVMNAIWGAHLLSLTKLIVVVDDDCDVHDYAEVAFRAFGNVDYAHDLLLTEGPVDHLDHASYQQFWGGKAGVDATRKLPDRGLHPRLAGGDAHVARRSSATGRQALEGVRHLMAAVDGTGAEPGRVKSLPAAGDDRALGVRAAVRLPVGADRDAGRRRPGATGCDLLLITVAMVGGADGRDGRQPDPRPAHRRAEPAYRRPRAGHRRGERADGLDRRGRRAGGLPRRRRACSTRSAWCSRRSPWCRWSSTPTASGSPTGRTRSSALAQVVGPVGAWLAVTGTLAAPGRRGCSASRWAPGSAAST